MYKFVFGIEEEKKIDVREMKCGHWPASRLTTRSSGKWVQFMDIDTKKPVNQALPVDYKKKYVPPKRPQTRQAPQKTPHLNLYKEACLTLAPQVVQEIANSTYSSTLYNSPPFEPPVSSLISSRPRSQQQKTRSRSPSPDSPHSPHSPGRYGNDLSLSLTARSQMPNTREPLVTSRSVKIAQTARLPSSEEKTERTSAKVYDFSAINLPETPRIINKRRGDDPEKFPFRISTLYLAELGEEQERREEMQRAKTATARSRSVQSSRRKDKRPNTSASTRKTEIRPNDKNRRLKQNVPQKTNGKKPMAIVGKSMTLFQ